MKAWDIDHVLVGPAGVIVVETKWSHDAWRLEPPSRWALDAVRRAEQNAADIRRWIRDVDVATAVFVWTPDVGQSDPPRDRAVKVGPTEVVTGQLSARAWRDARLLASTKLTREDIDRIFTKIDKQLRARDTHDEAADPVPATVTRAYWTLAGAVAAFVGSFLGAVYAYTLTGSWAVWGLGVAAELAVGVLGRWVVPRAIWMSWLAGVTAVTALAVAAVLLA